MGVKHNHGRAHPDNAAQPCRPQLNAVHSGLHHMQVTSVTTTSALTSCKAGLTLTKTMAMFSSGSGLSRYPGSSCSRVFRGSKLRLARRLGMTSINSTACSKSASMLWLPRLMICSAGMTGEWCWFQLAESSIKHQQAEQWGSVSSTACSKSASMLWLPRLLICNAGMTDEWCWLQLAESGSKH